MTKSFRLSPALAGMTSAIALFASAAPTWAQDSAASDETADAQDSGTIIVTAQRRSENLQDVPVLSSRI